MKYKFKKTVVYFISASKFNSNFCLKINVVSLNEKLLQQKEIRARLCINILSLQESNLLPVIV